MAQRRIGRRPMFFFVLVLLSMALYYPTPPDFRWVCWFCAGLAAFWSVTLLLQDLTTPRAPLGVRSRTQAVETPFGPPPRPGKGP
ncbi:MAG TPA: hypothetical protein DIT48_13240 [Actinobacteria bacterium]|jgi:hypothetical protein|nr:hypothetical protein [Actinomycetota bacterium]